MGDSNSKMKHITLQLHGLDREGITNLWTVLHRGEIKTTLEKTIGFNIGKISVSKYIDWDFAGRETLRPLNRHYNQIIDGFVYIIDSNGDEERLDKSIDELNRSFFQAKDTRNKVILVLANKQDKATALPVETIEERIREQISINESTHGERFVLVKGCNINTKEGLCEAFSVFIEQIALQNGQKLSPGSLKIDSKMGETDSDKKSKIQALNGKKGSHFHALKKLFDFSSLKFKSVLSH